MSANPSQDLKEATELVKRKLIRHIALDEDKEVKAMIAAYPEIPLLSKIWELKQHVFRNEHDKAEAILATNSSELLPYLNQLLMLYVLFGKQVEAETVLEFAPKLLLSKSQAEDFSGRTIIGTPFQAALGAEDERMWRMMERCLKMLESIGIIKSAKEEMKKQFDGQFPDGIASIPALKLQSDYNDLVTAIISDDDNGDAAIDAFRKKITQRKIIKSGMHFNMQHLLAAYYAYVYNFGALATPNNQDKYWQKVIGYVQRQMPANYGQVYCNGITTVDEHPERFERTLDFYSDGNSDGKFFPLASGVGLGFDFAVYSNASGAKCISSEQRGILASLNYGGVDKCGGIDKICREKTESLKSFKRELNAATDEPLDFVEKEFWLLSMVRNERERVALYMQFQHEKRLFLDYAYCIGYFKYMEGEFSKIRARELRNKKIRELYQELELPLLTSSRAGFNFFALFGEEYFSTGLVEEYLLSASSNIASKIRSLKAKIGKLSSPELDAKIDTHSKKSLALIFDVLESSSENRVKEVSEDMGYESKQSFYRSFTYLSSRADTDILKIKAVSLYTRLPDKKYALNQMLDFLLREANVAVFKWIIKYKIIDINEPITYFNLDSDKVTSTPLGVAFGYLLLCWRYRFDCTKGDYDSMVVEFCDLIDVLIKSGSTNNVKINMPWGEDEMSNFVCNNSTTAIAECTLKEVAVFFKNYYSEFLSEKLIATFDSIITACPVEDEVSAAVISPAI